MEGREEIDFELQVALNHLGCCERGLGNFGLARRHLRSSLAIARRDKAIIWINLCAVHSQLHE